MVKRRAQYRYRSDTLLQSIMAVSNAFCSKIETGPARLRCSVYFKSLRYSAGAMPTVRRNTCAKWLGLV
jgi:hypothetical protein